MQKAFAQTHQSNLNQPVYCGTDAPGEQWEKQFQELLRNIPVKRASGKNQAVLYTIPVIIHVLHGGEPVGTYPNLAQGQLNSQIQVLNEDFGGIGYNSGNYPLTAFSDYAIGDSLDPSSLDALGRVKIANCNVQFCLATVDSLGNPLPEPGIDRINYVSRSWSDPGSFGTINGLRNFINVTVKPQTIWNPTKYLNIWVTDNNINSNGLLGYATFPMLSGLTGVPVGSVGTYSTDGYWCYAKVFGSKTIFPAGTYYGGYERGRTSTHEIGHWLGLRHIGGDAGGSGNCAATDYCDDTPPQRGGYSGGQGGQNFGSPAYPLFATGASSCPSALNGNMFMNFMDYTDDNSKYMYTANQAERVQTAMMNGPYRKFLGTHNLCSVISIASAAQFKSVSTACQLAKVTLTNTSYGTPIPSYTWSSASNVTFLPDANSAAAVIFNTPGTHVITLTTDNGTVSVFSKTITVNAAPSLSLSVQSRDVCIDEPFNIEASGANAYVWKPGNVAGATMVYTASADENYTVTATGAAGCTRTVEIALKVVDCTGIKDLYTSQNLFNVYPNPSKGLINVVSKMEGETHVVIEVADISGKLVDKKTHAFTKDNAGLQINISSFDKGLYILKLTTDKGNVHFIKLVKE